MWVFYRCISTQLWLSSLTPKSLLSAQWGWAGSGAVRQPAVGTSPCSPVPHTQRWPAEPGWGWPWGQGPRLGSADKIHRVGYSCTHSMRAAAEMQPQSPRRILLTAASGHIAAFPALRMQFAWCANIWAAKPLVLGYVAEPVRASRAPYIFFRSLYISNFTWTIRNMMGWWMWLPTSVSECPQTEKPCSKLSTVRLFCPIPLWHVFMGHSLF